MSIAEETVVKTACGIKMVAVLFLIIKMKTSRNILDITMVDLARQHLWTVRDQKPVVGAWGGVIVKMEKQRGENVR